MKLRVSIVKKPSLTFQVAGLEEELPIVVFPIINLLLIEVLASLYHQAFPNPDDRTVVPCDQPPRKSASCPPHSLLRTKAIRTRHPRTPDLYWQTTSSSHHHSSSSQALSSPPHHYLQPSS